MDNVVNVCAYAPHIMGANKLNFAIFATLCFSMHFRNLGKSRAYWRTLNLKNNKHFQFIGFVDWKTFEYSRIFSYFWRLFAGCSSLIFRWFSYILSVTCATHANTHHPFAISKKKNNGKKFADNNILITVKFTKSNIKMIFKQIKMRSKFSRIYFTAH